MIFLWHSPLSNFLLDHSRMIGDPTFEKKGPFHMGTYNHCSAWWNLKGCGLWLDRLRSMTDLLGLSFLLLPRIISPPGLINYINYWSIFTSFCRGIKKKKHSSWVVTILVFIIQHDLQVVQIPLEGMWFMYPPWTQPRKCSAVFSESHHNLSSCPVWFC